MQSKEKKVSSIFEELGFANHEEMVAKADFAIQINALIKTRKLSCEAAAQLLVISETEIGDLHKGRLTGFSCESLRALLDILKQ